MEENADLYDGYNDFNPLLDTEVDRLFYTTESSQILLFLFLFF